MPVVRRNPNSDNPTLPYLEHSADHTFINEKREKIFKVHRMRNIKVTQVIPSILHVCKNCLAMFESQDRNVRNALCTYCANFEAQMVNIDSDSIKTQEALEEVITDKRKNETQSNKSKFNEIQTTESGLSVENCLKNSAVREFTAEKEKKKYMKFNDYVWPYDKTVICMNMKEKVSNKKKSKSNSKELGTFENKYRQIVKIIRSKNSDGSVSEERKTITIKTEKSKPSCSQATSSSSVKKEKNVTVTSSSKECSSKSSSKKDVNTSKSHAEARQTRSEKISLSGMMGTPILKTSLSDDTLRHISSIDSNTAKDLEEIKSFSKKGNNSLTITEHKDVNSDLCSCDVPNKNSKVRIKEVKSSHTIHPAKTLMELTNSQKQKLPLDSDNVSLVSFATSYSIDEGHESIQITENNVLNPDLVEAKIRSKDITFDNTLEDKGTACSASFIEQGADTSDSKNRMFKIPSYMDISPKLFSKTRHVRDHVYEKASNVSKTGHSDTASTKIIVSSPTQTQESSFPIACQSKDRNHRLIDEIGFQLPTSKMFTDFTEAMRNINVPNNYHSNRPTVKSIDHKSNEMKRLEDLYKMKIRKKQSEVVSDNPEPSTAYPRITNKLESDSMFRLSHDIPIRTRMHNESPRVSGEINYSYLNANLVPKPNRTLEGTENFNYKNKADAVIETDTNVTGDTPKPLTENKGTSPVGSFPLIPLKIHEIIPRCLVNRATSPKLSIANLPVISASSQLTVQQHVLNNELPKIPSVSRTLFRDQTLNQEEMESNSVCEIKIVPKSMNCLNAEDAEITVERLKELLSNNKLAKFEKNINPTVKELSKVPNDTTFPRPHVVCPVAPIISETEIKAYSCNSSSSCLNPQCPVRKMCCPPKPEKKPKSTPSKPPEKVDVAVSTFEKDRPKRKVDFQQSECKSTCSVPVELPKCAKCRATLMRADASTNTKTNARFDVRPLSKLILTRVITETQSDSCLYCGKPCGKPGFRRGGQRNIKSPSPSFQCCSKPIPRAASLSNCRFFGCDC